MRHGVAGVSIGLAAVLVACSTDPGVHVVERQVAQGFDGVPITIDDATTLLTLDNGLTVYLRHNERPGSSADIRLAIDAGSAMETPEQSGVAHFLEHMMFNGTEQFPANELVDVLRGFGMEFGADLNAYTSYDETVYQLTVPLADPASLGTGLDVAQQWLSAASLDEAAVAAERGVVLDEWRVREQSFDGRESVALYGMMLDGTSYADRAPIGVQQAIESMTAAPLRDFYDTWYRPDNAALVVVGDIDIDEVESLVRDRFEGLGPRGDIVEPPTTALGALGETKVTVFSDPDTLQMSAALMYPALQAPPATTADLRRAFLPGLAFDMIATRLSDDAVRGTAEFRTADSYSLDPVRPLAVPAVWLEADPSAAAATIDSLMVEFERVARYGFDDNELQRALDGYRSAVESAHESRDTVQDYRYADDMVDHYLMGASISSADFKYETWMTILDSVTATDVNLAIDLLVEASAPNLFVSVPDGTEVPSEADLTAALAALATRDIEPREQTAAAGDELMAAPEPVEEETDEAYLSEPGFYLDSHRLVFPNGAVVILNATDIVAESVVIEAQSPGGLSALPDSDVWAARYAPDVAAGSGVGGLDQVAVDSVLGGADGSIERKHLHPADPNVYTDDSCAESSYGQSVQRALLRLIRIRLADTIKPPRGPIERIRADVTRRGGVSRPEFSADAIVSVNLTMF